MAESVIQYDGFTYIGNAIGKNPVYLPSGWKEMIVSVVSGENSLLVVNFYIQRNQVESSRYFMGGNRTNEVTLDGSGLPNNVKLFIWSYNGANYTDSSRFYVYCK